MSTDDKKEKKKKKVEKEPEVAPTDASKKKEVQCTRGAHSPRARRLCSTRCVRRRRRRAGAPRGLGVFFSRSICRPLGSRRRQVGPNRARQRA